VAKKKSPSARVEELHRHLVAACEYPRTPKSLKQELQKLAAEAAAISRELSSTAEVKDKARFTRFLESCKELLMSIAKLWSG
jgi:hypothetical protein